MPIRPQASRDGGRYGAIRRTNARGAMPPLRYAPGAIDVTLLQRDLKLPRKSLRRSLTQGMAPSQERVVKRAATFSEELHGSPFHNFVQARR